jgi:hypothetical protein
MLGRFGLHALAPQGEDGGRDGGVVGVLLGRRPAVERAQHVLEGDVVDVQVAETLDATGATDELEALVGAGGTTAASNVPPPRSWTPTVGPGSTRSV